MFSYFGPASSFFIMPVCYHPTTLMFVDADAKLSWFIIRNELGINNSIKFAKKHSAPLEIIDAISNREYILSIYNENDTDDIKQIDWHKHLIKAKRFTTSEEYIERFAHSHDLNYYYAFTDNIPSHNIKSDKILSFNDYLKQKS